MLPSWSIFFPFLVAPFNTCFLDVKRYSTVQLQIPTYSGCMSIFAYHLTELETVLCRLIFGVFLFKLPNKKNAKLKVFYSHTIRIYHECEGRIEKSVTRITIWHHEAYRVMTNGDPEGRIFLSYPHTNNGFFSCSPLFFNFKISFQKS